jgi:hypothetical protein
MITKEQLHSTLNFGHEMGDSYFAVEVEMEGFTRTEIIVNEMENIEDKLEYYGRVYDDDMKHKHGKVRIIGASTGRTVQETVDYLWM